MTSATTDKPAFRAKCFTHVGASNVPFNAGAVLYGPRPLRSDGHPSADWEPANAAAEALTSPLGHARIISKPAENDIPQAPFANMELTEVVNGTPRYNFKRAERPDPDEGRPMFRYTGARASRVGNVVRQQNDVFSAAYIDDALRERVEALNDEGREVLTRRMNPMDGAA